MFPHEKLRIVVLVVAIGLCASFVLALPSRELSITGVSLTLSGRSVLGLILIGLTCTGVEAIVSDAPTNDVASRPVGTLPPSVQHSILHWILPAALILAAWALLNRPTDTTIKAVGVLATSLALAAIVAGEYYAIAFTDHRRAALNLSLHLMAYLLAMLLYVAIGEGMPAGWPSALAVTLVSAPLALRLTCDETCSTERLWPLALGLGAVLGFSAWLFQFWTTAALMHALAEVVLLYVLTGLAKPWHLGRLTRRVVAEYLLVGLAALALLFSYAR
jgi:hypothetical protein